jgi:hypothetical protein
MLQTLVIQTDNEQALEAMKALARELGLKFSPFDSDDDYTEEQEAQDLAYIAKHRHETPIDWETAKKMLAEGAVDAL